MFFSPSAVLTFFFTLFLVGQVAAVPLPMPMILTRATFQAAIERSIKRQSPDVQVPSRSDGGPIVPYKRQTVDVEVAAKSDGGAIVAYKRQATNVEDAVKSDGGPVIPYKRYAEIPSEMAVRSVDGVIELY
ncbi:hypothetical protein BDM02DRAFT_3126712 [Thelephora ganbajun]|uniref:Uncharacterized protein n=1 Tax=Thelephora ganbajun TaxID=370292 RepID=A0ACB6ZR37_THEGA|nr:hypothetical protein BDM02DRAFT_3126712 [Thelephora ganbajun]